MSEYDPAHEEIEVTRVATGERWVHVYKVNACRSGCVVKSVSKTLETGRHNIVTTIGELVLEGFEALDENCSHCGMASCVCIDAEK